MSGLNEKLRDIGYRAQDFLERGWSRLDRRIDGMVGDADSHQDRTIAQQFGPDAAAIEEARVPISAHVALYIILAFIFIAGLWAIFGTLDRIVVAPGKVATRTPMIVMQPFTTSRIMQIHVKPGDHVRKGQVLVSFDPAFAQADQASLEQKMRDRSAEIARLEAELSDAPSFAVAASESPERRTQAQIFQQEMATYSAELTQRDSRVAQIDSQIKAGRASIAGLRQQLDIAQEVVAIQERLRDQQAAAPLDVMKAQSSEVDSDLRLKNTLSDDEKLTEQRTEAVAERRSYLDKWRSDHSQQLVQARQDLAETSETLNKARRMEDLTEMAAPVDAVVLEIADRSVGSVLREAETLVTLVPDAADLYVEANVPSRDVGYVKVGNKVRVKLEAYPFQRYGTLDGVLEVISADSISLKQDDQSQLVYRVRVRLVQTPAELAERAIRLRPGLVATAEITTGKRSIASYILDPVLRTADESLREP